MTRKKLVLYHNSTRNLVREKWLTRKKNLSLQNHFSRTTFLEKWLQNKCSSAFQVFLNAVSFKFLFFNNMLQNTDFELPMKPFLLEIPNSWAWADNLGSLGYFWPIYKHAFWYYEPLVHIFHCSITYFYKKLI